MNIWNLLKPVIPPNMKKKIVHNLCAIEGNIIAFLSPNIISKYTREHYFLNRASIDMYICFYEINDFISTEKLTCILL